MAFLEEMDNNVGGLYQKAVQILKTDHTVSDSDSGTITFDPSSGISKEDQQDIIQNINQIMQSSKIQVTPHIFQIKAEKKGISFPFFVNLVALLLLAAGVFIGWIFFQSEETSIVNPNNAVTSAGQIIISELKKKAEADLALKNKEIDDIKTDLDKVNDDLNNLKENMNEEIALKERDLRTKLNQELETERQRLITAGVSTAELERRMTTLRGEQDALFGRELDRIKLEAEADRQKKEQELLQQKTEFNTQLSLAQEVFRKTEQEYALELSKQEQAATEAQKRIQTLSAQKEKVDLINDQVTGYYRLIQADFRNGEYNSARTGLKELRTYLGQPFVSGIPEIGRRYDVEMFIIDRLQDLMKSEEQLASADTQQIYTQASVVTDIRKLVIEADESYRNGDKIRADALYLKALQLIPDINKSHVYFINKVKEIEDYRKSRVAGFLETASSQFRARQYSEALASYGRALEYLPTDQNITRILDEIKTVGYQIENSRLTVSDSNRAEERLKQGNERLQQAAYDEAISIYLDILKNNPKTSQANEAALQLERTIRLKDEAFSKQVSTLPANSGDIEAYQKEIAVLKKTLSDRELELAVLKGTASNLELSRLEAENKRVIAENELRNLESMSAEYKKLQLDYATYSRHEDDVVRYGSIEELALGKSYLDSFLSSPTVKSAFPGLIERIKRYDRAFEQAGRNSTIQDTIDIITEANRYRTKEEKIAYLQKRLAASGDELTTILIKSLIGLISG